MWPDDDEDEEALGSGGFERGPDIVARPPADQAVERRANPQRPTEAESSAAGDHEAERQRLEEASRTVQAFQSRLAHEWEALKQLHEERLRDLQQRGEALSRSGEQAARSAQHAADQVQARLLLLEEGVGRNLATAARDLQGSARLLRSHTVPETAREAAPAPVEASRPSLWAVIAVSSAMLALATAGLTYLRMSELAERTATAERQAASALEMARRETRQAPDGVAASVMTAPDVRLVPLEGRAAAPSASGQVWWSATRGITFRATRVPALPDGRAVQAWVVSRDGTARLGPLSRDTDGRLDGTFPPPRESSTVLGFLVTSEPAGSSVPGNAVLLESRQ